jgi:hypothetical protein
MMTRLLYIFSVIFLLASCSKMDEKPLSGSDSILVKPLTENVPEAQPVKADTATGLLIDQSRYYTPEQQALLKRFSAIEVVRVFHDFRSIRKPGITQNQIDSFTKVKKISTDELKAILQEGDRRGWGKR